MRGKTISANLRKRISISILPTKLCFEMREAFTGRGEVFVHGGEMIFQRLVKTLIHVVGQTFSLPVTAARQSQIFPAMGKRCLFSR